MEYCIWLFYFFLVFNFALEFILILSLVLFSVCSHLVWDIMFDLLVLFFCSFLFLYLIWDIAVISLNLFLSYFLSCLPIYSPFGLGYCIHLAGLIFLLSPVLSSIWSGMLHPPRWACLDLVPGLGSQFIPPLVWDVVSASLVLSFSCLRSCLLGGLASQLIPHLVWDPMFLVLSPSWFLIWLGC